MFVALTWLHILGPNNDKSHQQLNSSSAVYKVALFANCFLSACLLRFGADVSQVFTNHSIGIFQILHEVAWVDKILLSSGIQL